MSVSAMAIVIPVAKETPLTRNTSTSSSRSSGSSSVSSGSSSSSNVYQAAQQDQDVYEGSKRPQSPVRAKSPKQPRSPSPVPTQPQQDIGQGKAPLQYSDGKMKAGADAHADKRMEHAVSLGMQAGPVAYVRSERSFKKLAKRLIKHPYGGDLATGILAPLRVQPPGVIQVGKTDGIESRGMEAKARRNFERSTQATVPEDARLLDRWSRALSSATKHVGENDHLAASHLLAVTLSFINSAENLSSVADSRKKRFSAVKFDLSEKLDRENGALQRLGQHG